MSALDAKAHHRRRMQDLTDDGSETIVGVAGGSSCYSKLYNNKNNSSSREMHVEICQQRGQTPVQDSQRCTVKVKCANHKGRT